MNNPLTVAAAITLAGMALLFLALTFFYGLLSLISLALHDRAPGPAPAETEGQAAAGQPAPAAGLEPMLRAAAIAVALARAEAEGRPGQATAGAASETLSPWWMLHQGRRVAAGSSPWRTS